MLSQVKKIILTAISGLYSENSKSLIDRKIAFLSIESTVWTLQFVNIDFNTSPISVLFKVLSILISILICVPLKYFKESPWPGAEWITLLKRNVEVL